MNFFNVCPESPADSGATPRLSDSNTDLIQAVIEEQAQLRILMLICMQNISACCRRNRRAITKTRPLRSWQYNIDVALFSMGVLHNSRPPSRYSRQQDRSEPYILCPGVDRSTLCLMHSNDRSDIASELCRVASGADQGHDCDRAG
jgi:hypothetical protein